MAGPMPWRPIRPAGRDAALHPRSRYAPDAMAHSARRVAFVEGQSGARTQRVDRQHARSGRGLENLIIPGDPRRLRREPGQRDRRAELLHLDLMLAAIGLRSAWAGQRHIAPPGFQTPPRRFTIWDPIASSSRLCL